MKTVQDVIDELKNYPPDMIFLGMKYDQSVEISKDTPVIVEEEVLFIRFRSKYTGKVEKMVVGVNEDLTRYKEPEILLGPVKALHFW